MKKLNLPLKNKDIRRLKVGESLLLSGKLYTARDAAHKILFNLLRSNKKLPLALKGATIYYTGPAPTPPRRAIGSCGPTTSARMDKFTPALLKAGVKAMIGKGRRSRAVKDAIKKYKAIYFLAPAGCGALLSEKITKRKPLLYKSLGPEAVYELEVKDFPVIVGIDSRAKDVFNRG